jgi:hypothetical protein
MKPLTPPGGLRPAVIAALAVLASVFAPAAHAADQLPLHIGSSGPRVCGLKWMISGPHGHRPNVFTKIQGTYTGALCPTRNAGYLGKPAGAAIFAYKYRLGYPAKWNSKTRPVAGPYFFALLRGTKLRPPAWVALAASRVTAIEPGATELALKVKALLLSQLGVQEQPLGSNRGPRISYAVGSSPSYQSATGAYGLAWCVSTQQWALQQAGYGTFADRTAGVYYAVDWAQQRNWLGAKAKVGALVAFITYDRAGRRVPGTGHIGFVAKVTASGFAYIAGNDANGVHERYIDFGARPYAFIYLPGVVA